MATRVVLSVLAHLTWICVVVTAQMRVVDLHLVVISQDRAVIYDVTVLCKGAKLR